MDYVGLVLLVVFMKELFVVVVVVGNRLDGFLGGPFLGVGCVWKLAIYWLCLWRNYLLLLL
jgi:hypothetical protein